MTAAIISRRAERELLDAALWMARDDWAAAEAFRAAVIGAAELIGRRPGIGVRRPQLASELYRFFSLRGFPYIIVYTTVETPPRIVRVVHGARDLPSVLRDLR